MEDYDSYLFIPICFCFRCFRKRKKDQPLSLFFFSSVSVVMIECEFLLYFWCIYERRERDGGREGEREGEFLVRNKNKGLSSLSGSPCVSDQEDPVHTQTSSYSSSSSSHTLYTSIYIYIYSIYLLDTQIRKRIDFFFSPSLSSSHCIRRE